MQICRLQIKNFRGIKSAKIFLPNHAVLIGDNNTGKTTLLEAINLALGPDRLNRTPPIDEHDFFQGLYIDSTDEMHEVGGINSDSSDNNGESIDQETENTNQLAENHPEDIHRIEIEVTILGLNDEQKNRFNDHIEFWNKDKDDFYVEPDLSGVDKPSIEEALRVTFLGWYDDELDDFEGRTYFTRSLTENDNPTFFTKKDKQFCGFLYLRSLRTGSRALSLEHGSLLDIILRIKEIKPQMWEDTISKLSSYSVASDQELGISGILESINNAIKKYVPKEWGAEPQLKVSNLTREHLRKVITAFIATGDGNHSAPFFMQGTGTINMLVLAMLSLIAEDKQNVIFAMEEPETAIPPYAQKSIVHEICKLSSQAIFSSHSPYVLEEFALEETVVLGRDGDGVLTQSKITLPDSVKPKRYRQEFRTRFCEGLLARRILIAEGSTETQSFPSVCRRLAELKPNTYETMEALGICTINAGSDSCIKDMALFYRKLGKQVFAICDNQTDEQKSQIEEQVDLLLMHNEKGFENLVLKNTTENALKRFASKVDWPQDLSQKYPNPGDQVQVAIREYFLRTKADWGVADFLIQCSENEIPQWLRESCINLKNVCQPGLADNVEDNISEMQEKAIEDEVH